MNRYLATFPAGTYALVVKHLKRFNLSELAIVGHDDSAVVFTSALQPERLIEIRYFTNVYLMVDVLKDVPKKFLKGQYFHIVQLTNGEPQAIDAALRAELEERVSHELGLRVNTHLAQNHFYLIQRSSGEQLLTLRLPRAKFKRETLSPGQLRPELAHILCLAAGIKARNIVADLFAGSGAIPLEAVRGYGCKRVIAVDVTTHPNRHQHPAIEWHTADARNLSFLSDQSVDRVVTDPPWGVYDDAIDPQALYTGFLQEAERVLKPGGVAVLLTSYDGALQCIAALKQLKLVGQWPVLVSGKKAIIFKLQKPLTQRHNKGVS
jgi:16S rRNA G966 N2-methylase RsmD